MFILTEINFYDFEFNGALKFDTLEEAQKVMKESHNKFHCFVTSEDEADGILQDYCGEYGACVCTDHDIWLQWDIIEV